MRVVLRDHGFQIAFCVGAVLATGAFGLRRAGRRSVGIGVPVVGAAFVGLAAADRGSATLVVALALLAAGGWLTAGRSALHRLVAAAPGATAAGVAVTAAAATWMRMAAGASSAMLAPLATAFDRALPRLTAPVLAVSALGVFATTPDTEHARVLMGATLGAAPFAVDARARPGPAGVAAFAGLLAWTAAVDGRARPGAVIGGVACAGVLALGPLVARARPPSVVVVTVHVALVAIAARVAGLRHSAWVAAGIAAAALVVGAVILVLAGRLVPGARLAGQPRSDNSRGCGPDRAA